MDINGHHLSFFAFTIFNSENEVFTDQLGVAFNFKVLAATFRLLSMLFKYIVQTLFLNRYRNELKSDYKDN